MVTADEIGAVTVFAALDADGRERLSRVAADVAGLSAPAWVGEHLARLEASLHLDT
jgi:hypothetical protein